MVWVSNQSAGTITVSITNVSGGSANVFNIISRVLENRNLNHWGRTGNEEATVTLANGAVRVFAVAPQDFIKVYDDGVAVFQAQTTHFA
jgi:hypothetical protein